MTECPRLSDDHSLAVELRAIKRLDATATLTLHPFTVLMLVDAVGSATLTEPYVR